MVILDEPTAALDPIAELEVFRQFASLTAGKTSFMISHRLGPARLADRILVLDRGRLVEQGTHDELMKRQGLYAYPYATQYPPQDAGGSRERETLISLAVGRGCFVFLRLVLGVTRTDAIRLPSKKVLLGENIIHKAIAHTASIATR